MWQPGCWLRVWQGGDDTNRAHDLWPRGLWPDSEPRAVGGGAGSVRGGGGDAAQHHRRAEQEDGLAEGAEVTQCGSTLIRDIKLMLYKQIYVYVLAYFDMRTSKNVHSTVNQETWDHWDPPGLWSQTCCPTEWPEVAQREALPPLPCLNLLWQDEVCLYSASYICTLLCICTRVFLIYMLGTVSIL